VRESESVTARESECESASESGWVRERESERECVRGRVRESAIGERMCERVRVGVLGMLLHSFRS